VPSDGDVFHLTNNTDPWCVPFTHSLTPLYVLRPTPTWRRNAEDSRHCPSVCTFPRYRKTGDDTPPQSGNADSYGTVDSPCAGSSSNPFTCTALGSARIPIWFPVGFVGLAPTAEQHAGFGVQLL
jgi:hypothetical protein